MPSKTFKNNEKNDTRTLEVDRIYGGARLSIIDANRKGFLVAPSDAPALALAILEAAGWNEDDTAVCELLAVIAHQAKATAEANEQAELEAEALELLNAYRDVSGGDPLAKWRQAGGAQEYWLAVARKAREMRAEK